MSAQTPETMTRREFETNLIVKAWRDESFKQKLINDPKGVYTQESGQELPENIKIGVVEESADTIYLVLPQKPQTLNVEEELTEEALEAVAGGWYIGAGSGYVIVCD